MVSLEYFFWPCFQVTLFPETEPSTQRQEFLVVLLSYEF